MAELLRRLKRHDERYYNFAKSVMYKHLFEACPGVNSILFLLSHFQLTQQVKLNAKDSVKRKCCIVFSLHFRLL